MSNKANSEVTRKELFEDYRKEISESPLFYDLIWGADFEVRMVLTKLKIFSEEKYHELVDELLSNKIETEEFQSFHYETPIDFSTLCNLQKAITETKGKVPRMNYIRKFDLSTHILDDVISTLQAQEQNRTLASESFTYEYGIRRIEVKKLYFSPKKTEEIDVSPKINIAIDGVAGAGKSTVAKLIAKKYNYNYIDTGLMYRTITYLANHAGIPITDDEYMIAEYKKHRVEYSNESVFVDDIDLSKIVRSPENSRITTIVARQERIRVFLQGLQRQLSLNKGVIMDGRDIGSSVLPNAELKFYFDANAKVRAERRVDQNSEHGYEEKFFNVLREIKERDESDKNRVFSPLIKVPGVIEIDTTFMTIPETVEQVSKYIDECVEKLAQKQNANKLGKSI